MTAYDIVRLLRESNKGTDIMLINVSEPIFRISAKNLKALTYPEGITHTDNSIISENKSYKVMLEINL